jgi:hypothetical protein
MLGIDGALGLPCRRSLTGAWAKRPGALLHAISKGGSWGSDSEPVLAAFLAAAILLTAWVPHELYSASRRWTFRFPPGYDPTPRPFTRSIGRRAGRRG